MGVIERGQRPNVYDSIGKTYTSTRAPDPIIGAQIISALDDTGSVLNVGAGTGSYEPVDRPVVALEPSLKMISQRSSNAAPVVCGMAEHLPFPDKSFDAIMGVLTLHHWIDQRRGLSELLRVARSRIVLLTFDPRESDQFWLVRDYFPEIKAIDEGIFPKPTEIGEILKTSRIEPVPIPHNCKDGFLCAFWKRPAAYLDPTVRAGISCFPAMPASDVEAGIKALETDLASGAWEMRNPALQDRESADLGYRLVVADLT